MHANEDPLLYFAEEYTTETYRATYAERLYPLSIEGLTPDLNVKPPIHLNSEDGQRQSVLERDNTLVRSVDVAIVAN